GCYQSADLGTASTDFAGTMYMTYERLTERDISRLALLQISLLPGAMAAQFGTGFARSFYRYVARSAEEVLSVRRKEGEIIAFCLASFAVHSLQRRLVTRTPLPFYALLGVMSRRFWRLVINMARDVFSGSRVFSTLPEVVILACDPKDRGRGHASQLLKEIEMTLRDRGIREYIVRTFDDDNNLAVKFYTRKGFTVIARFAAHGTSFRSMRKTLEAHAKVRNNSCFD